MNYTYRLHPLIRQDYNEAYKWYEDQEKGLGERFIKAVRFKIEQIVLHPETVAEAIKNSEKQELIISLTWSFIK